MKPISWLWTELHDLFDTDDGSLPEIRVNYVEREAMVAGYNLLRRRAARIVTEKPYFWSKVHNAERALDSVSNAATLVVSDEAEPFHVVLGGIQARNTTIPDLGVFVLPDQLALDYRMGPAWGASELEALFQVLLELRDLDPNATVSLEEDVVTEVSRRFESAWRRCRLTTACSGRRLASPQMLSVRA
jgi:hypothetical protein